jgi:TPR repeat protein
MIGATLMVSAPTSGEEIGNNGTRYALLIGVRKYDPNELHALPYTESDVIELAGVLKDQGYASQNVVVMTQSTGAEDTRFLPLAANIRKELKLLLASCDGDDSLVVALAGHGVQFQGEGESYFCPADARLADKSTLVPLSEVYKALENCHASLKLLLVDACRNDPQGQNSRDRQIVHLESVTRPQRTTPPGGVLAFFSCSEGERAFEHSDLKHGVFFHFVIEALKGAAVGPDQNDVSVPDLLKYVSRHVTDFVRDKYGALQLPEWKGTNRDLVPLVSLRYRTSADIHGIGTLATLWRPIGQAAAAELDQPAFQPQVVFLVPGGAGDRLGLKRSDIVLTVDRYPVSTVDDAVAAIRNRNLGARVELEVIRAKERLSLSGRFMTQLLDPQIIARVRQLAESGDLEAQVALGTFFAEGQFTLKDEVQSANWFRRAAESGHAVAQFGLGRMYANGTGVARDDAIAFQWFQKSAEQGDAAGQNGLGWLYREGRGTPSNDPQAVFWLRKAADQAHPPAQSNLGLMYKDGRGVTQDDSEAVVWFRKAAARGNAAAQLNLGIMFCEGRGVGKDDAEAMRWFRLSANQGNSAAQNNIGVLYRDARGVTNDDVVAVEWFRKAAEFGNAIGQHNLGWMYEKGRGVSPNLSEAAAWYYKAALQNNAVAECNLGLLFENGRAFPQDLKGAAAWYRRAAQHGNKRAAEALQRLNLQP